MKSFLFPLLNFGQADMQEPEERHGLTFHYLLTDQCGWLPYIWEHNSQNLASVVLHKSNGGVLHIWNPYADVSQM